MAILAGFLSNHLIDFIVIAMTMLFLIFALIFEYKTRNRVSSSYAEKYLQIHQPYPDADSRYRATDLLVESFEDDLIDEIDRSIKDIEIDRFYEEDSSSVPQYDDYYEHFLLEEDSLTAPQDGAIHDRLLKAYWVKMSAMLKTEMKIDKFALLEKDEDGLFSVVKNVDFSFQTVDTLKFTEYDKFYSHFFIKGINLYITKNVFQNSELEKMFSPDDKKNIGELMFFPIRKADDVIGILCCARPAGQLPLDKEHLKHKIIHPSRL